MPRTIQNEIHRQISDLIPYGLPLFSQSHRKEPVEYSEIRLLQKLNALAENSDSFTDVDERERKALLAFLWAISTHFRKTWQQIPTCLKLWSEHQEPQGLEFHLRRMSLETLGRYL